MDGHSEKVAFIWSVADLLRGDYKASDYGKVILPFTVLCETVPAVPVFVLSLMRKSVVS